MTTAVNLDDPISVQSDDDRWYRAVGQFFMGWSELERTLAKFLTRIVPDERGVPDSFSASDSIYLALPDFDTRLKVIDETFAIRLGLLDFRHELPERSGVEAKWKKLRADINRLKRIRDSVAISILDATSTKDGRYFTVLVPQSLDPKFRTLSQRNLDQANKELNHASSAVYALSSLLSDIREKKAKAAREVLESLLDPGFGPKKLALTTV